MSTTLSPSRRRSIERNIERHERWQEHLVALRRSLVDLRYAHQGVAIDESFDYDIMGGGLSLLIEHLHFAIEDSKNYNESQRKVLES